MEGAKRRECLMVAVIASLIGFGLMGTWSAQGARGESDLDARVSRFLSDTRGSWTDWNVPYEDGRILYDLVLRGNYKNILEIGTSTGHSTIWLAWAASKTGGKVTTIEIDEGRHRVALENFEKAGVGSYIDSRLGDAHEVVPILNGPFDFVFSDADKEWYLQYFRGLEPKMSPNGCFTAHNVLWLDDPGIKRFLDYIKRDPRFRTTIERKSREGISISYKIAN
jgi:predicted O-methyltransferase YrrM